MDDDRVLEPDNITERAWEPPAIRPLGAAISDVTEIGTVQRPSEIETPFGLNYGDVPPS